MNPSEHHLPLTHKSKGSYDDVINGKGYYVNYKLTPNELREITSYVQSQWLDVILIKYPSVAKQILKQKIHISDYHKISPNLNHSELWPKSSRLLPISTAQYLYKTSLFSNLFRDYGLIEISDEEKIGRPNIYWRLVRPNELDDIGPLHRDSWFWALNKNHPTPQYPFYRVKVWIPLYCEAGTNGLLLEPYSQNRTDILWSSEYRHGLNKPVLNMDPNHLNAQLVFTNPGQAIVFNDDLLHGGALNTAEKCRISFEFTIFARK